MQELMEMLRMYGINNEKELDEAIKNMKFDISVFVEGSSSE